MAFVLDERLQQDCFVLGNFELCQVLLMNNAAVPWFILVPQTDAKEICDLPVAEQAELWSEVRDIAEFVRNTYELDKLNVAAIGNVVSQLHIHVVGRRKDDYCWPDVVWGRPAPETIDENRAAEVAQELGNYIEGFSP
jgi:diadenosine tetraphosphate (Ap4A) HIT family hydrolase